MKAIEPFMETLLIILHNVMHSPCAPGLFPREGPCIGMRPPIQEYYYSSEDTLHAQYCQLI